MAKLADLYNSIEHAQDPRAALLDHAFSGLSEDEISSMTNNAAGRFYRGKVRDLIIEDKQIEIIHSDRLTAFDRFIDLVPYKGVMLNSLSAFWLERAREVLPTHLIEKKSDRSLLVQRTEPIKVEVVVRGYLAGSMARAYAKGARQFCGVALADGLTEYQKLPTPIITPTTKAPVGDHDEAISHEEVLERRLCTSAEWRIICDYALRLFKLGGDVCAEHDWTLVDTKYEFGRQSDGEIVLIDEIHTPDSSRFWQHRSANAGKKPVMLDKQIVRNWLQEHGFEGDGDVPTVPVSKLLELGRVYLYVCETITRQPCIIG